MIWSYIVYHAGCDVPSPIDNDDGDNRYAADQVDPEQKTPSVNDLQFFGVVKQKRGSANEEVGEVTMNFAKQRDSG